MIPPGVTIRFCLFTLNYQILFDYILIHFDDILAHFDPFQTISSFSNTLLKCNVFEINILSIAGIAYQISALGVCHSVAPIPVEGPDVVSKDGEHVVIRKPASFFALNGLDDVDWIYEGWVGVPIGLIFVGR